MLTKLTILRNKLTQEYHAYREGFISQQEYLKRIKPIDQAIDNIEMSTLQGTLALRGSSSQLSQQPES